MMGNNKSICASCSLRTICNYKPEFRKFEISCSFCSLAYAKGLESEYNKIKAGIMEICCPARVVFEEEREEKRK